MADMLTQDEINALLAQTGGDDSSDSSFGGLGTGAPAPDISSVSVSAPAPVMQPAAAPISQPQPTISYTPPSVSVQMPVKGDMGYFGDISLKMSVFLGKTKMPLKEALKLAKGSVVELEKIQGEYADIFINNKLFARGEIVLVDENFGIRIKKIIDIEEREQLLKRQ
ncbi:flagellar motor switch protein FliN [Candidatus Dependentiae bacterium]|nr:flagellar motor switch protein FliN [Candidatus Dependentiae bacterium]